MNPTHWTFPGRESEPAHEVWIPEGLSGEAPAVVLAGDLWSRPGHGLASALGGELAAKGFVAVSVSPSRGRDSKAFAHATLEDRAEDLERVVTALFERMVAPGQVNIRKIAVAGHGIGGTLAVARAAEDERIGAVVAIAAPRTPAAYFPKKTLDAWAAHQTVPAQDPSDGTIHGLGPELFRDWKARESALDHSNGARATRAPVLWLHGTEDTVVNVDDSRRAYWRHPDAGRRARLVEIAGAGHELEGPARGKLVEALAEFLSESFKS